MVLGFVHLSAIKPETRKNWSASDFILSHYICIRNTVRSDYILWCIENESRPKFAEKRIFTMGSDFGALLGLAIDTVSCIIFLKLYNWCKTTTDRVKVTFLYIVWE